MQPHIIKQGDFLALLAYKYGFDADTVWNDAANAELSQKRSDPNQLWPTDLLKIPDPASPKTYRLSTGQTNTFTSAPPTTKVSLTFLEEALASRSFTVQELPELTGLHTDSDGSVTFSVPVDQGTFTVVFDPDARFTCRLGHLDPVSTFSGVVQRLQNLGYLDPDGSFTKGRLGDVRSALEALKYETQSADASGADDDSDDDSDDSGDDSDGDAPDDGGLDDNGLPDSAAQQVLIDAHGC